LVNIYFFEETIPKTLKRILYYNCLPDITNLTSEGLKITVIFWRVHFYGIAVKSSDAIWSRCPECRECVKSRPQKKGIKGIDFNRLQVKNGKQIKLFITKRLRNLNKKYLRTLRFKSLLDGWVSLSWNLGKNFFKIVFY